jgi:hypothetical protein
MNRETIMTSTRMRVSLARQTMMKLAASALARRFAPFQAWIPGRRTFALILLAADLWWVG